MSFALDGSHQEGAVTVSFVKDEKNTNDPTLASIVNTDHSLKEETDKENYVATSCSAAISGMVTLDSGKLAATSGKPGTYTVKISKSDSQ